MEWKEEEVVGIIAEEIGLPAGRVVPELSIGDVPSWNSMAQMAILMALERRLGIEIPPEDLFGLTTVRAIVGEVGKLRPGRKG